MADEGSGATSELDAGAPLLDIKTAATEAVQEGLHWPNLNPEGRCNTLNRTGSMAVTIRKPVEKFIRTAARPGRKVLEIGPAYGLVCMEALRRGAGDYTIVELGSAHLKILAKEILDNMPEKAGAVTLVNGAFPDENVLQRLTSYDAILANSVLHFLSEDRVKMAFRQLWRLLNPGGKLMLSVTTVHLPPGVLTADVVDRLEQDMAAFRIRWRESKGKEIDFPASLSNALSAVNQKFADRIAMSKNAYFLFDRDVVLYLLEKNKFRVEMCQYHSLGGVWKGGRDQLEVVAQKPQ